MAAQMAPFERRLNGVVTGWPGSLADEFLKYRRALKSGIAPVASAWGEAPPAPYWMNLPEWICRLGSAARSDEFVQEVVWGQVCLFYAVRIQDDIFDGQLSRTPLALASTLLLSESELVFSSLLEEETSFWEFYRKAIKTTVEGIIRVSELQRDPIAPADQLLEAYARVDAIFTVGSAAVCEKLDQNSILPPLCAFIGETGKVAQAFDDFEDLDEDLADGRFNYPTKLLLARAGPGACEAEQLTKRLPSLMQRGVIDDFSVALNACLDRAAHAIAPLKLPGAAEMIDRYRRALRELGEGAGLLSSRRMSLKGDS